MSASLIIFMLPLLFTLGSPLPGMAQKPAPTKDAPSPTKEGEENRQAEAEETKRSTELFLRNQNVFLRKGELMLELDSFYNRNSQETITPVPGGIAVARTTRRFFDNRAIARYGILTDGLEVDVIAPFFVHAEQVTDFGVGQVNRQEDGIGDISGALRYQAWYERGSRPSIIFDVEGKSRTGGTGLTGTGNWGVGGGITLTKTIDPVVFFARLGYTHNIASGSRNLGDIIDYRVGMGFSLNDRVSFTIQLNGAHIGASQFTVVGDIGGALGTAGKLVVTGRQIEVMNLLFTTTVLITKNFFVEPIVGVGLTENSFAIVGIRFPYRF